MVTMRYHQDSEAFSRVQRFHERRGAHHVCTQDGDPSARSGIQKNRRREPAQARTEAKGQAEGQAFRFPRPCRLVRYRFADADQFGVGKAFADNLRDSHGEPIGVVHVLPIIKSERLFIQIPKQVVRLYAHIGSVDSTLEQCPKILAGISVYLPVHVGYSVVDYLVGKLTVQPLVGLQRVAVQRGTSFHVIADQGLKLSLAALVYDFCANLAAALQNGSDDGFALSAASSTMKLARFIALMHIPRLTADESLVHFNFAGKFAAANTVLQGQPNPVEHVPCTLLGDSKRAVEFPRTNAVLHIGLHPDCGKPLVETQRRIFHDGSDFNGKLSLGVTALALPKPPRRDIPYILRSAGRADYAILPFRPMRQEVGNTVVGVGKVDDCVLKGLRFGCHKPILKEVA
jgi:hypothetical protein